MRKRWKFIAITLVILSTAVLFLLLLKGPGYDATYASTAETPLEITVRVRQSHPLFAEYERVLIVRSGGKQIERRMFSDSGSYSDANLFELPNGDFIVEGAFDGYRITPSPLQVVESEAEEKPAGRYLGTFAFSKSEKPGFRGEWRFLKASEAPYRKLTPPEP